jgi:hypothetical protein
MKKFTERTNADIYLEYVNDFITIERMAEYYEVTEEKLGNIIHKGRQEHEENVKRLKAQ